MLEEIKRKDIELNFNDYSFSLVEEGDKIIGQDKAMGLLRLGLNISRPGYNIFLSGDEGSGKLTALNEEIRKIEKNLSFLKDAAYLYNTGHPTRPIAVTFERGKAREFQRDLDFLKENKTTKESLIEKWSDNAKLEKFLLSLPQYDVLPEAWTINIVLDRSASTRRPLVIEAHPSKTSLFGFIDKEETAPHLRVRCGSYQEAGGGFLVLSASEICDNEELWLTLKRYLDMTMRSLSSTAVQGEMMGSIRPSPIALLTKVILTGPEEIYEKIAESDETFFRYFKVSPEFDFSMAMTKENINGSVSYLKKAKICSKETTALIEKSYATPLKLPKTEQGLQLNSLF